MGMKKNGKPSSNGKKNANGETDITKAKTHGEAKQILANLTINKKAQKPQNRGTGWHDLFLEYMRRTGNVTAACNAAATTRTVAYDHRARFPEFAQAWDEAYEAAVDALELRAWHRADSFDEEIWIKNENGVPT